MITDKQLVQIEMLTLEQVGKLLNLSVPTVRKLTMGKGLPYYSFGRKIQISKDELMTWLEKHKAIRTNE
jgi:excisionase family DNA binding protein